MLIFLIMAMTLMLTLVMVDDVVFGGGVCDD